MILTTTPQYIVTDNKGNQFPLKDIYVQAYPKQIEIWGINQGDASNTFKLIITINGDNVNEYGCLSLNVAMKEITDSLYI
jgi:hypothetical protein